MHNTKEKRNAYLQQYRDTHREILQLSDKSRRRSRREWAIALLGGQCVQCGRDRALHFDHIDPSTKIGEISNLLRRSEETLRNELEKCQLLCDRCHRIKTSENGEYQAPAQHGSSQMYGKYKCRCNVCKLWKRNFTIEWKRQRAKIVPPAVT